MLGALFPPGHMSSSSSSAKREAVPNGADTSSKRPRPYSGNVPPHPNAPPPKPRMQGGARGVVDFARATPWCSICQQGGGATASSDAADLAEGKFADGGKTPRSRRSLSASIHRPAPPTSSSSNSHQSSALSSPTLPPSSARCHCCVHAGCPAVRAACEARRELHQARILAGRPRRCYRRLAGRIPGDGCANDGALEQRARLSAMAGQRQDWHLELPGNEGVSGARDNDRLAEFRRRLGAIAAREDDGATGRIPKASLPPLAPLATATDSLLLPSSSPSSQSQRTQLKQRSRPLSARSPSSSAGYSAATDAAPAASPATQLFYPPSRRRAARGCLRHSSSRY